MWHLNKNWIYIWYTSHTIAFDIVNFFITNWNDELNLESFFGSSLCVVVIFLFFCSWSFFEIIGYKPVLDRIKCSLGEGSHFEMVNFICFLMGKNFASYSGHEFSCADRSECSTFMNFKNYSLYATLFWFTSHINPVKRAIPGFMTFCNTREQYSKFSWRILVFQFDFFLWSVFISSSFCTWGRRISFFEKLSSSVLFIVFFFPPIVYCIDFKCSV